MESAELGKASRIIDAAGRYIEFCKGTFPSELSLKGLKIVVDCANGATYHIAPSVLRELGATVIAIGVEPDGMNINENAVLPTCVSCRSACCRKKRTLAWRLTATATA